MYVLVAFFFILGLVFGSFGCVLITRLPRAKKITGRSQCIHCEMVLMGHHLVPVCSYVSLRGKCSGCNFPISILYPTVELASGFLFVGALFLVPFALVTAFLLALTLWLLLLISIIDARTMEVPDVLSLPLLLFAVLTSLSLNGALELSGVILAAGFFGLQWILSRGTWVGSGDVIIAVAIGFLLADYGLVLIALLLSYVLGAVYASVLLITKKIDRKARLPFGPFLATGTVITLVVGPHILMRLFHVL